MVCIWRSLPIIFFLVISVKLCSLTIHSLRSLFIFAPSDLALDLSNLLGLFRISGPHKSGNTGKFTTLTGISGIFTDSAGFGLTSTTSGATVDVSGSYVGNAASISALNINCSSGNYFTKTIAGNSTFTISDAPASGRSYGLTLEITHTSGTITWFSGVYWPADTAPTLTEGKTHLFVFITDDGGTKWRGASLVDYSG